MMGLASPRGVGDVCHQPCPAAASARALQRPPRVAAGWLHKKLGSPHDAADLAQDTFLRIFSRAPQPAELQALRDLVCAIDPQVGLPHTLNLRHQLRIAPGTHRAQGWLLLACGMAPICRWGDLQDTADRLDQ